MRRLVAFLAVLLLCTLCAIPLMAQGEPITAVGAVDTCLKFGVLIGLAVGLLKRLPFGIGKWIAANPRTLATFLATIAPIAALIHGGGASVAAIAQCVATQLFASIGTHELALKYTPLS